MLRMWMPGVAQPRHPRYSTGMTTGTVYVTSFKKKRKSRHNYFDRARSSSSPATRRKWLSVADEK